ncbi:hypothetical protein MCEMRE203_00151 [Candidatus Nanopelagicaceae bacterium]
MSRYIGPTVAVISILFALRAHIKMKELEITLSLKSFPHKEWDALNPIRERKWNSPGEPQEIWRSRALENDLRKKRDAHWDARNLLVILSLLATALSF